MKLHLIVLLLVASTAAARERWAVLVAGSNGYNNYRHHADVCHAYHILRARNFKDENIITMLYDDVAYDYHNKFQGQLFNKASRYASSEEPVDVNENCRKDYTGSDVSPENFLNIITGNATAMRDIGSGKVLNSTGDDYVFINFVDHGAVGLLAFPSGELYKKDLLKAFSKMHESKMYDKLLVYTEACESGSMFAELPKDLSIYITTASNGQESSWGTYCPPQDKVQGVAMSTCLGDLYSINWMQDADKGDNNETIIQQFKITREETKKSHVEEFGDLSIGDMAVSDFLGVAVKKSIIHEAAPPGDLDDAVDSRDIPLVNAFYRYLRDNKQASYDELLLELSHRKEVDEFFGQLVNKVFIGQAVDRQNILQGKVGNFDHVNTCHRELNEAYKRHCRTSFSDYSLKYSNTLLATCESDEKVGFDVKDVALKHIETLCKSKSTSVESPLAALN